MQTATPTRNAKISPPCAICGAPSDPAQSVSTGGGCDYPVCGDAHAAAVWLALDAADAHEEGATTGAPPWPVAYPPDWVGGAATGTLSELEAWARDAKNAAALAAVRGA